MAQQAATRSDGGRIEAIIDDVEGKVELHVVELVLDRFLPLVRADRGRGLADTVLREPCLQMSIRALAAEQLDQC
ncbi:hypothetical protein D3C81_1793520 [compost metagenome]